MKPRQNIVEMFSTFLSFSEDLDMGWLTDGKLAENMRQCQKHLSSAGDSEKFWVLYWCKQWQENPRSLARMHLVAYLQESCFWSVSKIISKVKSKYSLADGFQMAISEIDKVLMGFNPSLGYQLKHYASAIFKSILTAILREGKEVDLCSDWALLRKISQKRLSLALKAQGLADNNLEAYILVSTGFTTFYLSDSPWKSKTLPPPDDTTWDTIARFCNSYSVKVKYTGETVEMMIKKCSLMVRSYSCPGIISLNTALSNEEESEEILDKIEDSQPLMMEKLMMKEDEKEEEKRLRELREIIKEGMNELSEEEKRLIKLYYHDNLTQQEIAKNLEIKQYAISRKLNKIRETLLKKIILWTKKFSVEMNINQIKDISILMEEWLELGINY